MTVETESAEGLMARAAALVPMLRERAMETEKSRRVAPDAMDALSEAGIFKMMAPKRYGGAEVNFETQCEFLGTIARACPSTSWVATIDSAMAWLAAVFPDEAQEEVFANRDPRISGVFTPTGANHAIMRAPTAVELYGRVLCGFEPNTLLY